MKILTIINKDTGESCPMHYDEAYLNDTSFMSELEETLWAYHRVWFEGQLEAISTDTLKTLRLTHIYITDGWSETYHIAIDLNADTAYIEAV